MSHIHYRSTEKYFFLFFPVVSSIMILIKEFIVSVFNYFPLHTLGVETNSGKKIQNIKTAGSICLTDFTLFMLKEDRESDQLLTTSGKKTNIFLFTSIQKG